MLWESAWREGNGDAIPNTQIKAVSKTKLRTLYRNKKFVPSMYLPDMLTSGLLPVHV